MFLPALCSRFHQSNVFLSNHGTKDLMQRIEFDDPYTVREAEKATSPIGERGKVKVGHNRSSDVFDLNPTPQLEPTPLGNYGINVVDEVSFTRFRVPSGEFDDWIKLLRGSANPDEINGVPTAGVATSIQNNSKAQGHDDSLQDSKPQPEGFNASKSRSRRPELQIKAHQNDQWNERFQELVEYHQTFGHSHVPYHYKKSASLAWWVKRQRHQYKMKQDGNHSTLTDERERKLEALGFCWDSHTAVWEERLNELIDHRRQHGHTTISQTYNPKLLIWVKCQRRQFKLYCAGEKSSMTQDRINKLNAAGFCWNPRRGTTEAEKKVAN
jgi:hypothetical protein